MIKLFIGLSLLSSTIYADRVYMLNGKRYMHYDKSIAKSVSREEINFDCFYKNGIISKESCYIQTGYILVSFIKSNLSVSDLKEEYNLEEIKEVNPLYKTILFKIKDEKIDPIDLVNDIKIKNPALTVRLNWKRPRFVR